MLSLNVIQRFDSHIEQIIDIQKCFPLFCSIFRHSIEWALFKRVQARIPNILPINICTVSKLKIWI